MEAAAPAKTAMPSRRPRSQAETNRDALAARQSQQMPHEPASARFAIPLWARSGVSRADDPVARYAHLAGDRTASSVAGLRPSRVPVTEPGNHLVPEIRARPGGLRPSVVHRALDDRSPGRPLEARLRAELAGELGGDFSEVRIHADDTAARLAADLNADAFTRGNDVYFGAGRYEPGAEAGRRLLRHELVHVVQQARGELSAYFGQIVPPEHASEARAASGTLGPAASSATGAARPSLQRQIKEWPSAQATVDEAKKAAAALEDAARAKAAQMGEFVPSWAVDPASQAGWRLVRVADLTPQEMDLLKDVLGAPEVIIGRSVNVKGGGMFVLDEWIEARGITWTQKWQDVYNKALYLRTSSGAPVKVMAGSGYSAGEVLAAEEGAAVGGITNQPYWPAVTPPPAAAGGATPEPGAGQAPQATAADAQAERAAVTTEQAAAETAIETGAEGTLKVGVASTVLEVAFNPALQFGWEMAKGFSEDYQEAWNRIRRPARHIGFAQGWVAKLVGLDRAWIRANLAPHFVDTANMAAEVIGATGMDEKAYIGGLAEGFRYGEGYSLAAARKPLGRAYAVLKQRGEVVQLDDRQQMARNSLILVAAVLQSEADQAISRWDELREQRAEAKADAADYKRRSETWTGHFQLCQPEPRQFPNCSASHAVTA